MTDKLWTNNDAVLLLFRHATISGHKMSDGDSAALIFVGRQVNRYADALDAHHSENHCNVCGLVKSETKETQ